MKDLFSVGDRIYGFCNGFFGRDDYKNKICVFVTDRYAVFEYLDSGYASVLNYYDEEECKKNWGDEEYFKKATQSWKIPEED